MNITLDFSVTSSHYQPFVPVSLKLYQTVERYTYTVSGLQIVRYIYNRSGN